MNCFWRNLPPKILGSGVSFNFHVFEGKQDLLNQLPIRLVAYRKWLPDDWRIVVLIDEDRQECEVLKARLEKAAGDTGFVTKSTATETGKFQVVNRLAIEELEAWFFGDIPALRSAYPRVSKNLGNRANYRDPDAIEGGTHEALERVLKQAGYYPTGMPKVEVAQNIAPHIDLNRNRSRSFQVFVEGIRECVS